MTVRDLPGALLIPSEALQAGPNGNFVYVAKPDQTVELRMVQTIPAGGQRLIVEKGLKPGERVITDGQLRLTPGAKYEARTPGGGGGAPGKGDPSKGGGGKAGAGGRDGAPGGGAAGGPLKDGPPAPPKDGPPKDASPKDTPPKDAIKGGPGGTPGGTPGGAPKDAPAVKG